MNPATLSASAVQTFVDCPAQFKANYIDRAQQLSNSAASLGTVCHATIEGWTKDGHYKTGDGHDWAIMKAYYDEAYWANFADEKRYAEGVKLLKIWLARQDWSKRTIISVEKKDSFILPVAGVQFKFNYIMDRFDMRSDGYPEVIDYKTLSQPLQPEELKQKIQARTYAVVAQLLHPDADRVWVTFDMLRYEPIGIVFTKEENRETWRYLTRIAQAILASDGSTERINPTCRWCIRKGICVTLHKHTVAGGTLAVTDAKWAAKQSYDLRNVVAGLQAQIADLDNIVIEALKQADQTEFSTEEIQVSVGVSGRRDIDAQMLAQIVGPDTMARYGKINVTSVDAMLKSEPLTDDQKSRIKALFTYNYSDPSVRIKEKGPF